ncbi:Ohr family peroxiredoxin [Chelatococcus reniformis]|uniref:Peroxiredoxin n=1 Tax=Chelatococcus reniformis TaxID=1494448 RepID=A0A916UKR5_9HYPH|nr:Ohr family peroxiredoxin [Chelatococcus reniformis]GGC75275.1 peroxiredoxin [Chelatococcus reniformis]
MSEQAKRLYTARVRTTGGRDKGVSRSSDGRLDLRLSPPGGPGTGTNPEQLFAAAWSACFDAAMERAAKAMDIRLPADVVVEVEIDLVAADGGHVLRARLAVTVPGLARDAAQAVVDAAEAACPYSNALRGNIAVAITLT